MSARGIVLIASAAAVLGACAKSQPENGTPQMADRPVYEGANVPYLATGWKPGDRGSWEQQLQRRVQNQNEYLRVK